MNANGLPRLYDRLAVWERIPFLIAATARKDDTEFRRLFDASPIRTWRFSEHLLAEQALHSLAMIYVGEQLDAAANYFFSLWRLDDADEPRPGDWRLVAAACAYYFAANADAWRRFCADLDIAPETLTVANHPGPFLPFCEERMPANAPTVEALRAKFWETGRSEVELVTADDLLASWRSQLRAMTRCTPHRGAKGGE